jgi:uncharacterized membrane protein
MCASAAPAARRWARGGWRDRHAVAAEHRCGSRAPPKEEIMKRAWESVGAALVAGVLVLVPLYLAILLLLKAMKSVGKLISPLVAMLPDWIPGEKLVALAVILVVCLIVGIAVRTAIGHAIRNRIERAFFEKIPGYALLRSLTQRLAGEGGETAWQPALVEIEEALVPGFIIEALDDGRFTVFVPSVPTPLAGAVYILDGARVHPLDVPFTQAVKSISRWGQGSKDLVAAMRPAGR